MQFKDIYGQEAVKQRLIKSVQENHMPHAQLFCGPQGAQKLALALAYAQYANCTNRTGDDSCGECPSCKKMATLMHPDLHFAFPIAKQDSKPSVCADYLKEWREMVTHHYPFTQEQWLDQIGAGNKQGMIYANESDEIIRALSSKSFEAAYKMMIIWLPETLNITCANKLLKEIEEPQGPTLFLLVSNSPDNVLGTIVSRTQRIEIPALDDESVYRFLKDRNPVATDEQIREVMKVAKGNLITAEGLLTGEADSQIYFDLFVKVMRAAYQRSSIKLMEWTKEVVDLGRKRQSLFLEYSQRMLRESFISNLKIPELNHMTDYETKFVAKFGPFINERNVAGLMDELGKAQRDIEQNVKDTMVFYDLALKITMFIKQ